MTCNPKRLLKSTIHIYEIMPSHYDISYAFLIWNGFFMHIKHILTSSLICILTDFLFSGSFLVTLELLLTSDMVFICLVYIEQRGLIF